MNTWRKCISLILCLSLSFYSFSVFSYQETSIQPVMYEMSDEAMDQIVGGGNLDVTMSEYKLGGTLAKAEVVNRSLLTATYELNLVSANGTVIETLSSGSISPNTATIVQGSPPYGGTNNRYIQAKVYVAGMPFFEAVDSSWAAESIDSDADGITDVMEIKHGLNPYLASDALDDPDGDGLTNIEEINLYRTNILIADTDGDSINDGNEIAYGLNPNNASDADLDPDMDFMSNAEEINLYHLDPAVANPGMAPDADNDGVNDKLELALGIDPNNAAVNSVGGDSAEEKRVAHVLNRLAFGPTSELLTTMHTVGVDSWIANELMPIGLDEMTPDPAQLIRDSYPTVTILDERVGSIRPVHSMKHLQSRMALFWDNHFSTHKGKTQTVAEFYEEDLFFVNAFGNFRTLLGMSAKSDAMLDYLDLATSRGNGANVPNENYAREVMELHTFGQLTEQGNYSADDVAALARILTGWSTGPTIPSRYQIRNNAGDFVTYNVSLFGFNSSWHNTEEKTFLSELFTAGGGQEEGERALDMLAYHSVTANYICQKLARHFVSDVPGVETLSACQSTFMAAAQAPDQIGQVLLTLFNSAQFTDVNNYRSKFKDNQEYIFSMARLLGTKAIGNTQPGGYINSTSLGDIINRTDQGLFGKQEPTGWEEEAHHWINTNAVMTRFREGNKLIFDSYHQVNLVDYFNGLGITSAGDIMEHLFLIMLGGKYDVRHMEMGYWALHPAHKAFAMTDTDAESRIKNLVARIAQLPEFNLH